MAEQVIVLEQADPNLFCGINNAHISTIKNLFSKVHIIARGNSLKAIGEEEDILLFTQKIAKIEQYVVAYNTLSEAVIIDIVKGESPEITKPNNLILHGLNGKPITARTENQQKLVELFDTHDLLFAEGPAGSGKTYTAIALAVRALKNKTIKKIILSRPAVEAGEKLGFLPGDMKEKIHPYLQPLYDALQDMIPALKLADYIERNIIQIAPLAFMRGRTLNDAVIILDEAQNTSTQQIKMFLTRLGINSKMIITGDVTQIDLPPAQTSGMIQSMTILQKVSGVAQIRFTKKDIVRHKLVSRIIEAYEEDAIENKEQRIKLNKKP